MFMHMRLVLFLPCVIPFATAENPKERKSSWFRDAAEKEASTGGVYIDAAHGVGAPKMEALAKVKTYTHWYSSLRY